MITELHYSKKGNQFQMEYPYRWDNCAQKKKWITEENQRENLPKGFVFLVWYYIDRGDQENESAFLCKKRFL